MKSAFSILTLASALLIAGLAAGCGDDHDTTPKDGPTIDGRVATDAGIDGATVDGPDASCFDNPQTNDEIINACTTAQKIYKDTTPPLTLPDGGLPPLMP